MDTTKNAVQSTVGEGEKKENKSEKFEYEIFEFEIEKAGRKFKFVAKDSYDRFSAFSLHREEPYSIDQQGYNDNEGIIYLHPPIWINGKRITGFRIEDENIKKKLKEMRERATKLREEAIEFAKNYTPIKLRWAYDGNTHLPDFVIDEDVNFIERPAILDKLDIVRRMIPCSYLEENSTKMYGYRTNSSVLGEEINDKNDKSKNWYGWYLIEFEKLKPFFDEYDDIQRKRAEKEERFWNKIAKSGVRLIAINCCWECGKRTIVGYMSPWGDVRMKKSDFDEALKHYRSAPVYKLSELQKELESNDEVLKNNKYICIEVSDEICPNGC